MVRAVILCGVAVAAFGVALIVHISKTNDLERTVNKQQNQIDDLKRELEEIKQKLR